jgi:type VI protein secretion system component VasK
MPALLLSPLARWLAIGAVLAALAGWLWIERGLRQSAEARADAAELAVAARDKAIAGLERQAADAAARTARFATLRRSVDAAPATQACAAAPAVRAALDGLRARPAAGGGAAQPAGLRAGAGGP